MATHKQLRKLLVDTSGRFDIVKDTIDYENNSVGNPGANYFLESARKFLDNRIRTHNSPAWVIQDVAANQSFIRFKDAKAIIEVWFQGSDGKKHRLTKTTSGHLTNDSDITTPYCWTPVAIRLSNQYKNLESASGATTPFTTVFTNDPKHILYADQGNNFEQRGIFISPTPDEDYQISIKGLFGSYALEADDDVNWWSYHHEDILINAANYRLEITYRNSEGQRDWLASIDQDLRGIDRNVVFEEAQMLEGSTIRMGGNYYG
jgi:hypothetical protein